jgi:hypothetical protein
MKVTQITTVQREDGDRLYALTDGGDLFYMDSDSVGDGSWHYITPPVNANIPEQVRSDRAQNSVRV